MIKSLDYKGWQNCYRMVKDDLSVVVIPQIGGRIYSLKYKDNEFFYQNINSVGRIATSQEEEWLNWGGDFDWIGPQQNWNQEGWPPPFEIDGAKWTVQDCTDTSITLVSPESLHGVVLKKTITLENSRVRVNKSIKNVSDSNLKWGLWNITQVPSNGVIEIDASDIGNPDDIKLFDYPRVDSLDILTENNVLDIVGEEDKSKLIINRNKGTFKIGLVNSDNTIVFRSGGYSLAKKTDSSIKEQFPHGCNIEVYRDESSGYPELEQLWEYKLLRPEESRNYLQIYEVS